MNIEQKRTLFQKYLPWGSFILDAIAPVLLQVQWLFFTVEGIGLMALAASVIVGIRVCKEEHISWIKYISDSTLDCCVWMFTSLVGIMIGYAMGYHEVIDVWLVFLFLDILELCAIIASKKLEKKKIEKQAEF